MMRNYLLLFALLGGFSLHAQFGIQTAATFNQGSSHFVTGVGEIDGYDYDPGVELALNYWFRLPKQRIEFLPTVYLNTAKVEDTDLRLNEYGAQMKVNIYPFDFLGDCDCPTFGKQGPQLQKGFFLQLTGGYAFYNMNTPDDFPVEIEGSESGFTYGGGIGMDIGLSNLVTLTPVAGVRRGTSQYTGITITDVNGEDLEQLDSKLTTFYAGLQLSFRLDHKRY